MKLLTFATCAAMALSGCASAPSTSSMSDTEAMTTLSQYHWQLSRATDKDGDYIHALFARPDKPLQLDFQNNRVHVANACNLLNGNVDIHDGKLEVKQMISTMMACMDPAVSNLDKAVSSRLEQAGDYRIDTGVTPPTFTLTTPDGDTLVFTGEPRDNADRN